MSDLGVRPVPQQQAPATGKPSSEVPLWILLTAVAVMLALAAAAAFALTYDGKDAATRTYPKQWDSRVAPYAKVAQKLRGLAFLHPVEVRFLPPAEFEKTLKADEVELSKEDGKELEQFAGLMRAFGMVKGDIDLFAAVNEFTGGGTLAYYSFEEERITIRGNRLTPAIRSTLVHELTHVLQDQQFEVGDRTEKLRKQSEDGESNSEMSVLRAVIEGDAERVETLYRDSLPKKQRKALDSGQGDETAQAMKRLKKIPNVVMTMMTLPYSLGAGLVDMVAEGEGNKAVDQLFRNAPKDDSALLDPFQVLAGQRSATDVEMPSLKDGEKKFDSGEFGAVSWYLMLAERLPLTDALTVADGWGGDAFVGFDRDGDSCARVAYLGDTPKDTARMLSALRRWDAAAPGAPAAVSRDGDRVRFESCDPGKAADVGKDVSLKAVELALTRTYLGRGLMESGAPEKVSRCLSQQLVQEFPVSALTDPKFGTGDPAVTQRVQQLAFRCR